MNATEFLEGTLRPTLLKMDMQSPSAEKLLLMTACHESGGFKYDRQVDGGPALSYYQIEPETLEDLYLNFLEYRPRRKALLNGFEPSANCTPEEALMDPVYATAAGRLIYSRVLQPLPAVDNDNGLADYWKAHWNTPLGKGTVDEFLKDWRHCKPAGFS